MISPLMLLLMIEKFPVCYAMCEDGFFANMNKARKKPFLLANQQNWQLQVKGIDEMTQ